MPTVVVLPAPFGPSNPKISPGSTSREIPSTATVSIFFLPFFPFGPPKEEPTAANGGGVLYTLRRSRVRMPTSMSILLLLGSGQFIQFARYAQEDGFQF